MRIATFLFSLCVVAALALAQLSTPPKDSAILQRGSRVSQPTPDSRAGSGVRMSRSAEIRVMPIDLLAASRVELQSLRERQGHLEADSKKLEVSDPAVREQISSQLQLIRAALSYVDRQDSDRGKSPAAIDVQRHLNRIEGKLMCEACHTSLVARVEDGHDRGKRHAVVNKSTPSSSGFE